MGQYLLRGAQGDSGDIRRRPTDVLVQEANEGGSHDVPVFAAELHGRLYPIIHH